MIECTSHHICVCQAAKMDQMKDEIETYKNTTKLRKSYDELVKMKAELIKQVEDMNTALGQATDVLLPYIDVKDW